MIFKKYLAIIFICLILKITSQTDEEIGKKRKAIACSKLMRLRIKADYVIFYE